MRRLLLNSVLMFAILFSIFGAAGTDGVEKASAGTYCNAYSYVTVGSNRVSGYGRGACDYDVYIEINTCLYNGWSGNAISCAYNYGTTWNIYASVYNGRCYFTSTWIPYYTYTQIWTGDGTYRAVRSATHYGQTYCY